MIWMLALALTAAAEDRVELWTVAGGGPFASSWGHTLLRIEHDGVDLVYNYGRFYYTDTFVWDYLTGQLDYWIDTEDPGRALGRYNAQDRGVLAQRIHMPAERLDALMAFLAVEVEPQNREFRYDEMFRNCTTQTRDVLDRFVFEGALHGAGAEVTEGQTPRQMSNDLLAELPPARWLAHAPYGPWLDQPSTRWEAWAIPDRLHSGLEDIRTHRLVAKLPEGVRIDPPRQVGPVEAQLHPEGEDSGWREASAAFFAWLLLFGLPAWRPKTPGATTAIAVGTISWSLLVGVASLALLLIGSRDSVAYELNAIVFGFHPFVLLLPGLAWKAREAWAKVALGVMATLPLTGLTIAILTGQHVGPYLVPALFVQTALTSWAFKR